jgi:hypothetical protein
LASRSVRACASASTRSRGSGDVGEAGARRRGLAVPRPGQHPPELPADKEEHQEPDSEQEAHARSDHPRRRSRAPLDRHGDVGRRRVLDQGGGNALGIRRLGQGAVGELKRGDPRALLQGEGGDLSARQTRVELRQRQVVQVGGGPTRTSDRARSDAGALGLLHLGDHVGVLAARAVDEQREEDAVDR